MISLCFRGLLALICLACVTSFVHSEADNRNNEYLRFGRENNNGYIRFGRNDPFLRFGKKNDPFLRFGRQDPFLRFGRQDPFLRFGKEDPFLRFGRNDLYLRFGRNDPYLRFGRNDPYLRFGKSDPFLRFGKSSESEVESDVDAITLAREHGFAEENEVNDRRKRSALAETNAEGHAAQVTRELRETNDNGKISEGKVAEKSSVREARNGPYMRFGKKSEVDLDDGTTFDRNFLQSEFSRFLRNYNNRLSLPRFGKRGDHNIERKQEYMRFGRALAAN